MLLKFISLIKTSHLHGSLVPARLTTFFCPILHDSIQIKYYKKYSILGTTSVSWNNLTTMTSFPVEEFDLPALSLEDIAKGNFYYIITTQLFDIT
jgi:hypothetical protein